MWGSKIKVLTVSMPNLLFCATWAYPSPSQLRTLIFSLSLSLSLSLSFRFLSLSPRTADQPPVRFRRPFSTLPGSLERSRRAEFGLVSCSRQLRRTTPHSPAKVPKNTQTSDRDISAVRCPIEVIPVPIDSERRDEENGTSSTA